MNENSVTIKKVSAITVHNSPIKILKSIFISYSSFSNSASVLYSLIKVKIVFIYISKYMA